MWRAGIVSERAITYWRLSSPTCNLGVTSKTTWKTCNLGVTWKTCKTLHQHMKTYRTYWRLSSPTRKRSQNCYQVDIIIAANSCLTLIKTPQDLHHKIATSSFAVVINPEEKLELLSTGHHNSCSPVWPSSKTTTSTPQDCDLQFCPFKRGLHGRTWSTPLCVDVHHRQTFLSKKKWRPICTHRHNQKYPLSETIRLVYFCNHLADADVWMRIQNHAFDGWNDLVMTLFDWFGTRDRDHDYFKFIQILPKYISFV